MRAPARIGAALFLAGLATQAACAPRRLPAPAPPPPPLPELRSGVVVTAPSERAEAPGRRDPLDGLPPGNPVTLVARNVDVRVLVASLAEQAGIDVLIDPTISARLTVSFTDTPALDALRAVLAAAKLGIAAGPPAPLTGPVVFYAVPVDVDRASAELIQSRFGVSAEMARWIAENQLP